MKIEYLRIKANPEIMINLDNKLTLIKGYSGTGKTLLFKFVEFLLGSDGKKIDYNEACNNFKELEYVEMQIKNDQNDYIFRRYFNPRSDTVFCNGELVKGIYKDILNEVIRFNPVQVFTNQREDNFSTFTLREYIKTVFFDETRLTSDKKLTEGESYTDTIKLKNFYKYLITGEYIESDLIQKVKSEKTEISETEQLFNILKKKIEMPTAEDKREYKNLNKKIKRYDELIIQTKNKLNELDNCREILLISNRKNESLVQLLESQIEDYRSSKQFAEFLKNATVTCDCGKKIKLVPFEVDINDYEEITNKIINIKKQIVNNNKEISKALDKERELNKELSKLQILKEEDTDKYEKLTNKINEYDLYLKIKAVFDYKQSHKKNVTDIKSKKEKIEASFSESVIKICQKASNRLKSWGLDKYNNVTFDNNDFDFRFDGTQRDKLAKGYKNICSSAVIIEILLRAVENNICSLKTIVIDSLWCGSYFETIGLSDLMNNIVVNLATTDLQIIIIENHIPNKIPENCRVYDLKDLKENG